MNEREQMKSTNGDSKAWAALPDEGTGSPDALLSALRDQGRVMQDRLDQEAFHFAELATKQLHAVEPVEALVTQAVVPGLTDQPSSPHRSRWPLFVGGLCLLGLGALYAIKHQASTESAAAATWMSGDLGARGVGAAIVHISAAETGTWIADFESLCQSHNVPTFRQELPDQAVRVQAKIPLQNEGLIKGLQELGIQVPANGNLTVVVSKPAQR